MSIEQETVYQALTFYANDITGNKNNIVWTIPGPLSGDLIAGLLVGLNTVLSDLLTNFGTYEYDYRLDIVFNEGRRIITIDLTYEYIKDIIPDYMVSEVREVIDLATTVQELLDNKTFAWIIDNMDTANFQEPNSAIIYKFKSADFVQGFISICTGFNVDFRNYVIGRPFVYNHETKDITQYSVEGYDIEPIPRFKRIAPPTPFYTFTHEADPYAQDYI